MINGSKRWKLLVPLVIVAALIYAAVVSTGYRGEVAPPGAPGNLQPLRAAVPPTVAVELVDIGPAIGLPRRKTFSAGLLVADLNQDGHLDILHIIHRPRPEMLYYGDGRGQFSPVPVMTPADRHECASADVNLDGLVDLYCSVGANRGGGSGANNLWLQQPDGTYVDVASDWGVTDEYGRGRDVVFLDANSDAYPDLFVSNAGPRSDEHLSSYHLYINDGGRAFVPAPEYGVDGTVGSECARAVDFDSDGDEDIVVCASDGVRMFANQGGAGFVDVAAANGFTRAVSSIDFADIDGDGDLDVAYSAGDYIAIHRLDRGADDGLLFEQHLESGSSVAFGDFNGDGVQDAYFAQRGCRNEEEGNLPDLLVMLDASGAAFPLQPPAVSKGCGYKVLAFDHDGDGRDGFLVGNGWVRPGPLQYLVMP